MVSEYIVCNISPLDFYQLVLQWWLPSNFWSPYAYACEITICLYMCPSWIYDMHKQCTFSQRPMSASHGWSRSDTYPPLYIFCMLRVSEHIISCGLPPMQSWWGISERDHPCVTDSTKGSAKERYNDVSVIPEKWILKTFPHVNPCYVVVVILHCWFIL